MERQETTLRWLVGSRETLLELWLPCQRERMALNLDNPGRMMLDALASSDALRELLVPAGPNRLPIVCWQLC